MSYSPTLGRFIETDPEEYVDGMSLYEAERSNPVNLLDPMGLQATGPTSRPTTGPTTRPTTNPALAHSGSGTWGEGINKVRYSWLMQDVSANAAVQKAMMTAGKSIFTAIKVKKLDKACPFTGFRWIQYSEARLNGKLYTPPGGKWPWQGIDRYPNNGRTDGDPYVYTPPEQGAVNAGKGYGGRVAGLYDTKDADTIFIDWASSGGLPNWGHYSVVTLIGIRDGKEYRLGSLMYEWSVDGKGNLTFGAREADAADTAAWQNSLNQNYAGYVGGVYGGTPK